MPRAPAPQWRRYKEPILDYLIKASVDQAKGLYNESGHYAELVYTGCESAVRAKLIKRHLHNAGKHLGFSVSATIERHGNEWHVRFKAIDKTMAKKYMIEHYGADRTKWPYSPWRHDPNYDPTTFKEDE